MISHRHRAALGVVTLLVAGLACQKQKEEAPVSPALVARENKVAPRAVQLYYETDDQLLAPEERAIPLPERDAVALSGLMQAWLAGPADPQRPRPFPSDTVLRGAYLLPNGDAVIDLGGASLVAGWQAGSHEEIMAVYGVVQTLSANLSEVRRVRFLVGGQVIETLGGHLSIDRPFVPRTDLLKR